MNTSASKFKGSQRAQAPRTELRTRLPSPSIVVFLEPPQRAIQEVQSEAHKLVDEVASEPSIDSETQVDASAPKKKSKKQD